VSPWIHLTGPSGASLLTQLFPVIKETLLDKSHQLLTNLTVAEGESLGLDTKAFPKNINGKEFGFRVVRANPKGWVLAGDTIDGHAADAQFAAGRAWETTARSPYKELLSVREATPAEVAARAGASAVK
jgi:hypothetical protein